MAEPAPSQRPPDHLSATDEDRPTEALRLARANLPPASEMPFAVWTPKGHQPFFPPPDSQPPASSEAHRLENDNPFNPKGGPSLSLPQQATPLTSDQGVMSPEDMIDPARSREIASVQDGLAPDNPENPRGTPDYIVEEYGGDPQIADPAQKAETEHHGQQ